MVSLYYHTLINMKLSQVFNMFRIRLLGLGCSLGVTPARYSTDIQNLEGLETLDFDPCFLARFPVDKLMKDKITILHSSKSFDWKSRWEFEDESILWNYNLHYFEFLFPLVKAWKDTGEKRYLNKTIEMINGWIENNPKGSRPGWDSYTTALRIVTWINYYGYVCDALDQYVRNQFLSSLYAQYVYLSMRLEKDILGNHYFENLKSLVLAALFFKDNAVLDKALADFKNECKEEILSDGMHFELSPTYHKLIFEGMLRVAAALRGVGRQDREIESYLQPMLDVAYSFENSLDRVPLFNDGGNNVAKSLDALVMTSELMFGLKPEFKGRLETSGFYIFEKIFDGKRWKLVVDAGQPGPEYIPGHAHCDAMSYELFCDGKPVIVNCGTYAYQCKERNFFRSTAAHNTVMVNGTEQSQYWGTFRLAKRSSTRVLDVSDDSITMEMTDQKGQKAQRTISFGKDSIIAVKDKTDSSDLLSYVHIAKGAFIHVTEGAYETYIDPYAADFGKKSTITTYEIYSTGNVAYYFNTDGTTKVTSHMRTKDQYSGYKPLVYLDKKLYFFKNGKLWSVRNGGMKFVVDVIEGSWKDKYRVFIRLFRREPKFAVPVDEHRLILAGYRKLLLIDVNNKDVREIFVSREGFSDPLNICKAEKNWIVVWGDYGSNPDHKAINIYGLKKDLSVETIYSFSPGLIRHVHNILPKVDGGYYVFTGDQEKNAGIYSADSSFKDIYPVLIGKQQYRAVVGFATSKGLLYATDAVNERNSIYLMKDGEPKEICGLNGSCIYGTEYQGAYFFATTVEPDENIRGITSWVSRKRGAGILSDEVTLVKVDLDMNVTEVLKYKKDNWPMKLMQYGAIQFPHGDSDDLWIYPIAVKKVDGKAIRFGARS